MKECPACRRCFPDHVNHCPNDGGETTPSIAGEPVLDGRYQLERRLGQGGMGVVYQARHIFLKTAHAIKIILPDLVGNDPALVTRFRQEALAAAAIRHQNIISVTDFGVVRGTMPFLVMEFVKGTSLHDLLTLEKKLSPSRAMEIIAAVGAGVGAAHRQNIVHRDLKPLNIMLQDGMSVAEGLKVLDFGLAKIKSGELLGSFVQAKTSGLMGSPFYMAPEQWSDEEPDVRADIYSIGVITYQMLGGDVPFKGTSIPAIMKKHLTELPPPFAVHGVDVPSRVEAAVRHALEKEARNRPPTVEAFINELRDSIVASHGEHKKGQTGPLGLEHATLISAPASAYVSMPPPTRAETTLRLHTEPPHSRVYINNIAVGTSDNGGQLVVREMQTGWHRVRVMHDGFAEWEQQIECNGGECPIEVQLQSLFQQSGTQIGDPLAGTISGDALGTQAQVQSQSAMEAQRLRAQALALEEQARLEAENLSRSQARREGEARQQSARDLSVGGDKTQHINEGGLSGGQSGPGTSKTGDMRQSITGGQSQPVAPTTFPEQTLVSQKLPTSDLTSTQGQRLGTVTQQLGDASLSELQKQAGYQQQQQQAAYAGAMPAGVTPKKSSLPIILVAAVVVVLGLGSAGYFFMSRSSVTPKPPVTVPGQTNLPTNPNGNSNPQTPAKPEMVAIPGGTFQMGRNDGTPQESPAHAVTVKDFMMDKTEVTNAEYALFVQETKHAAPTGWTGDKPLAGQERWPVSNVSIEDANAFAAWRSKRDGETYRLPTEEEWEYAARGGDQNNLYPWGKDWVNGRAAMNEATAQAVGSYQEGQSRWGTLDMLGNVWEWTSSKASLYTGNSAQIPPQFKGANVFRGGSFASDPSDKKTPITNAYRDWLPASTKADVLGFRLVKTQ
jgi:formylglycine-generating enzyme required for sulfatase activity/serine/threonine protein kinase